MIWWLIGIIYFLCRTGVMQALDDSERDSSRSVTLIAVAVVVVIWPMFFMFAVTTCLRCIADGSKRKVATR